MECKFKEEYNNFQWTLKTLTFKTANWENLSGLTSNLREQEWKWLEWLLLSQALQDIWCIKMCPKSNKNFLTERMTPCWTLTLWCQAPQFLQIIWDIGTSRAITDLWFHFTLFSKNCVFLIIINLNNFKLVLSYN